MIWPSQQNQGQYYTDDHLSLEFLHALNIWPFEVVQDSSTVQEHVASLIEQFCLPIRLGLLHLDEPLASFLLPICSNDLSVEGHVFSQTPNFADFVKVFPYIG